MRSRTTIPTTCTRDCPNTCGLVATVEHGRLVSLKGDPNHPYTRGVACAKCARYIDRVYSPERITHPLIRASRSAPWRRATWDEVLDLIAERMTQIRDTSGPEAILYYQGYGERTALKLLNRYFFNLFGGVTFIRGSLCGGTGQAAQNLDFGERISHDPLDHYNSNAMILWGRNPASTNISLVPIIHDIRKRGGPVIIVDPVHTRSTQLATHHIQPRAGSDAFLAMAAAKLILEAGAEDRTFMEQHSVGAAEYRRLLDAYTVDDLCARSGVAVADARHITDALLHHGPTSILLGWGLHRHEHAHHAIRAIDALGAISGNIGISGGGVSQGFEEYGPYDQQYWGDHLAPPRRTLRMPTIGADILNASAPPIRMIMVTAANPVCMAPNSDNVTEAFAKTEFVVYSGHVLDDTADLAHVFLPATTFLEEQDVMASYGHNYVGGVNKVIEPVGECRSEFHMFSDLAARFPFAGQFRRPIGDWLHDLCAPLREQGCNPATLNTAAFRYPAPMVPYADKTFATPSGTFQFMTEAPPETLGRPAPDYPYRLLTIAPHGHICSERTMAEHDALPHVTLASAEAARLGLMDGDSVAVRSVTGSVTALLRTRNNQRPDILVAERGGWRKAGHGLNRITRDLSSAVGMGTPYYETSVRVEPLSPCGQPRILVVQHHADVPGGVFCKALQSSGARLTTIPPDTAPLPESPEDWDGLVVLGGPQQAADDITSPHFPSLMALMRGFDASDKPVAAICLGGQLLARAWGAPTRAMNALEFGFVQFRLTEAGKRDPLFTNTPDLPPLMSYHEDSFTLPESAMLLVRGEQCANQCFVVGTKSYGFQFHLEADALTAHKWMTDLRNRQAGSYDRYAEQFDDAFFIAMKETLPLAAEASARYCRTVAQNWLRLVPCAQGKSDSTP